MVNFLDDYRDIVKYLKRFFELLPEISLQQPG